MIGHFFTLLKSISENPEATVSQLQILTEQESGQILKEWNNTKTEYPHKCIHHVFEEQADHNPDKLALVYEDTTVSYRELNARANRLARLLQNKGVALNDNVGICMNKSIDFVVSVLAILKAGATYVPIDDMYPKERLSFISSDTNLKIIITDTLTEEDIPDLDISFLNLDKERAVIEQQSFLNVQTETNEDSSAYIMYTSGSTGNRNAASERCGVAERRLLG